jgi:hypothetical protein
MSSVSSSILEKVEKYLAAALIAAQKPDGAWFNTNSRHWENRPSLVTSYSLISLSYCLKK